MKKLIILKILIALILIIVPYSAFAGDEYQEIFSNYQYDAFNRGADPWQLLTVEYNSKSSAGSVLGRINHAERFNKTGQQVEIDVYHNLTDKMYVYINAGFSSSDNLFPDSRYGFDIYNSLPYAFEASLGLRNMNYTNSHINLYTAYIGKSYSDYWFSFRYYYNPDPVTFSSSGHLALRRYFQDAYNFITVNLISGHTPDENNYTTGQLRDNKISMDFQFSIFSESLFLKGEIGLENEEISQNNFRNRTIYALGVKQRL
ncbi:YaiO family outer membrane beta-barrel protein [Candidatus Margulisiibacteriota bacterium]